MNISEVIYFLTFELFQKLTTFSEEAFRFLITRIEIGSITISMWELIGGSSLFLFLTLWLIAKIAPFFE